MSVRGNHCSCSTKEETKEKDLPIAWQQNLNYFPTAKQRQCATSTRQGIWWLVNGLKHKVFRRGLTDVPYIISWFLLFIKPKLSKKIFAQLRKRKKNKENPRNMRRDSSLFTPSILFHLCLFQCTLAVDSRPGPTTYKHVTMSKSFPSPPKACFHICKIVIIVSSISTPRGCCRDFNR